jgi:Spx/MgsR family transcriptional regulator
MAVTVYGIKNCNTVKSALDWLTKNKVAFEFHDFKTRGVSESKLVEWCDQTGWEALVNKRGTTWRTLDASVQEKVADQTAAIALMREKTSVIKRPVVESGGKILALGFDSEMYSKAFRR